MAAIIPATRIRGEELVHNDSGEHRPAISVGEFKKIPEMPKNSIMHLSIL
jgi:hypothetical protein